MEMQGQIDVVTPEQKLQMVRAVNFQQFEQLTSKTNWLMSILLEEIVAFPIWEFWRE